MIGNMVSESCPKCQWREEMGGVTIGYDLRGSWVHKWIEMWCSSYAGYKPWIGNNCSGCVNVALVPLKGLAVVLYKLEIMR